MAGVLVNVVIDADDQPNVHGHSFRTPDGSESLILAVRMGMVTLQGEPDVMVSWLEAALKAAAEERARVWPAVLDGVS